MLPALALVAATHALPPKLKPPPPALALAVLAPAVAALPRQPCLVLPPCRRPAAPLALVVVPYLLLLAVEEKRYGSTSKMLVDACTWPIFHGT